MYVHADGGNGAKDVYTETLLQLSEMGSSSSHKLPPSLVVVLNKWSYNSKEIFDQHQNVEKFTQQFLSLLILKGE